MESMNRKQLLRQLEETRNTIQRQHLLKQLWRLDRQEVRRDDPHPVVASSAQPAVPVAAGRL